MQLEENPLIPSEISYLGYRSPYLPESICPSAGKKECGYGIKRCQGNSWRVQTRPDMESTWTSLGTCMEHPSFGTFTCIEHPSLGTCSSMDIHLLVHALAWTSITWYIRLHWTSSSFSWDSPDLLDQYNLTLNQSRQESRTLLICATVIAKNPSSVSKSYRFGYYVGWTSPTDELVPLDYPICCNFLKYQAGEMAHRLKECSELIPNTHISQLTTVCNSSSKGSGASCVLNHTQTHIYTEF